MKFLYLFIIFLYTSFGWAEGDPSGTEAGYGSGNKSMDFCCDREYKQESAHSLSEMESQQIVSRFLRANTELPIKPKNYKPSKGQR